MPKQPLGEVFGFAVSNTESRASRYRKDKLCPYNNIVSSCTKNSIENPLGVCSILHNEDPVIVCPVRFREDWTIVSDAAEFLLDQKNSWTNLGEVSLKDNRGKSARKIDLYRRNYDATRMERTRGILGI